MRHLVMSSKKKIKSPAPPPWTHIPDDWLGALISVNTERSHADLMWDHLATCNVCRDRYWEMATKAKALQRQAQLSGGHPLFAIINEVMGKAMSAAPQLSWPDVPVKLLAHVEKLGDEELTPANMDLMELALPDFGDPAHVKQ